MRLPTPPPRYDARREAQRNNVIERAYAGTRKVGRDVELADERLILKSPDGTRWQVHVQNDGSLTTSPL